MAANYFSDEEYQEFMLPYELEIYRHIQSKTKFDVLHICKDNIDFKRFSRMKPTVINWGFFGKNPKIEEGRKAFPDSVTAGGLPVTGGILEFGSDGQITDYVKELCKKMKGQRFILGADCTYPPDGIPYGRLAAAAAACRCD